jgi:hypothetical protein
MRDYDSLIGKCGRVTVILDALGDLAFEKVRRIVLDDAEEAPSGLKREGLRPCRDFDGLLVTLNQIVATV